MNVFGRRPPLIFTISPNSPLRLDFEFPVVDVQLIEGIVGRTQDLIAPDALINLNCKSAPISKPSLPCPFPIGYI